MRRWHHGHSLGAGILGGVLLHGWPLFLAGVAVGALLVLGSRFFRRAAVKTGGVVDAQTALVLERVKTERARRRSHVDRSRSSRAAQDQAYRRGYIEGKLDA